MVRIIGLDPGLNKTGWGVIVSEGNKLHHIANGTIRTDTLLSMAERLVTIDRGISEVIEAYQPDEASVEIIFLNINAQSTLKLAHARGVVLMVPARYGVIVREYGAKHVKKSIIGTGNAPKSQVEAMVSRLLPAVKFSSQDASDALAVAICHAHHRAFNASIGGAQ